MTSHTTIPPRAYRVVFALLGGLLIACVALCIVWELS